jgi:hypothetical protein
MSENSAWYIVKTADGTCQITADDFDPTTITTKWGPCATREEAIAKRVGLIRAGKCQPVSSTPPGDQSPG